MNWSKFLINVSALYLFYYAINICIDIIKTRGWRKSARVDDTLFFADDVVPTLVPVVQEVVESQSAITEIKEETVAAIEAPQATLDSLPYLKIESTGGTVMKDIFMLVKADMIHKTRPISFS
ncbi:hypothetical protein [Desertivirga xinjiangensis]|uniref:hypothetical protein n=1 Tax=Desertivirga xinjiangensis TaxID=539206 RepID=UPI00210A84AA|nr:hypothetical protein [Pedobacter xinjiangensis]